ncbi:Inositol 2-dehydrogenase/D-chiro-inositol 3-dehydrogenase [subsurface metagenome]
MLAEEKLDAVDILTPPDTHADLAIQAMQHGCHCLMEKPLTITTTDADRVVKVAKGTGLGLFVTHNLSFFPGMRRAKTMVASGAVGKLVSVHVRFITSIRRERYFEPGHWCHHLPGGIFSDLSPHLAMMLVELLDDISCVKAVTKKVSDYPHITADELEVMVEAGNGLGSFALSYNSPLTRFTIDMVGTKMSLSVNDSQIVVCHKPVTGYKTVGSFIEGIPRGLGVLSEIFQQLAGLSSTTVSTILGRYNYLEGHRYLIEAALDNIRGERTYPVDIGKCREVVRILEEAFGSLK